jgi:hypothetical protein
MFVVSVQPFQRERFGFNIFSGYLSFFSVVVSNLLQLTSNQLLSFILPLITCFVCSKWDVMIVCAPPL